ncbi:hypothetical protein BO70DRAFT_393689 [Aspergillus heteromorphus CBS 117.55]|uniref:Uncharacterized protein n=1 Tax=Aspergillus heteromorphus CBS 117.55 TaxID=1448321 RepID=A0A317WS29_9EURO|nr:uncharacterized protein BO70DRAFT_393689 [Aspergillus heteromorphus CBS 117.55]PWY89179.1 hypothetical protein BO70DRAFT_393689 [Aspergillus heteromorphus CBS 117.55]
MQLQKLDLRHPVTGESIWFDPGFAKYWTGLPELRIWVVDEWHSGWGDNDNDCEALRNFENMDAFLAQLSAMADVEYGAGNEWHPLDFSIFPIYMCRDALVRRNKCEPQVRSACRWFIYAAERIWHNCKHRRFRKEYEAPWSGFSFKCWHTWERGLRAIQSEYPPGSTRMMVTAALKEIDRVEEMITHSYLYFVTCLGHIVLSRSSQLPQGKEGNHTGL